MRDLVKNRERTIFTGEVDRISNSGNGIIEFEKGHIHLGPLPDQAAGEDIKGVMTGSTHRYSSTPFAYCVNDKYITAEYLEWVSEKFEPELRDIYRYPQPMIVKVQRVNSIGTVAYDPRCSQGIVVSSPPEEIESGDIIKVRLKNTDEENYEVGSKFVSSDLRAEFVSNKVSSEMYEKAIDEWIEDAKERLDIAEIRASDPDIRITHSGDYETTESTPSTEQSSEKPESTPSTEQSSEKDLDELREKAQKESTENATGSTTSRTQTTQQYHRSQAVREYVMGRADGVCEGCGETAPFTSKTGDPYLHAHHIHELSDGGSDTPDTVIALCPNCHYRVHHGEDGNEYNKELEQKLSKIEE